MKFTIASSLLIWSTTASKPILTLSCSTYEEGYKHGVELAQYEREEGEFTCTTISDFEEKLHLYETMHYPTDMDNEKSNAGMFWRKSIKNVPLLAQICHPLYLLPPV